MRVSTLPTGSDHGEAGAGDLRHAEDIGNPGGEERSRSESDDALVRAAQREPEAFGSLYQLYLTRIYRYMRVRVASDEDAADLTQQLFLRAFDALPRYREKGLPFSAWLFRIARNLVTDTLRQRKPSSAWAKLPEAAAEEMPDSMNLEAEVLRDEAVTHLRTLVAALPPDKRELLAFRFEAELTAREIALVLGKSEAAIYKQINRILNALKEQYQETSNER